MAGLYPFNPDKVLKINTWAQLQATGMLDISVCLDSDSESDDDSDFDERVHEAATLTLTPTRT